MTTTLTGNVKLTSNQERAINLLGAGISAEQVAAAIGVDPSYISQLVSNPEFSELIAQKRFEALQKHNVRDNNYDEMEDELLTRMKDLIPLMTRPMEVLRSIQVINAAKRRGASTPDSIINKQTQVNLVLPKVIIQKYTTNVHNQIIAVAGQELLTIDSNQLLKKIGNSNDSRNSKEVKGVTS